MILASMNLLNYTANPRAIVANDYEKVLRNKSYLLVCRHYLHVRKSLPICTHFILALYDKDASIAEDAMRFFPAIDI